MLDLASVVSDVRRGMIPAHVYADPEIFAAERDRLFARSWMFLAHESEILDPGDYVVRRVRDLGLVREEHPGPGEEPVAFGREDLRVAVNVRRDQAAPHLADYGG